MFFVIFKLLYGINIIHLYITEYLKVDFRNDHMHTACITVRAIGINIG